MTIEINIENIVEAETEGLDFLSQENYPYTKPLHGFIMNI